MLAYQHRHEVVSNVKRFATHGWFPPAVQTVGPAQRRVSHAGLQLTLAEPTRPGAVGLATVARSENVRPGEQECDPEPLKPAETWKSESFRCFKVRPIMSEQLDDLDPISQAPYANVWFLFFLAISPFKWGRFRVKRCCFSSSLDQNRLILFAVLPFSSFFLLWVMCLFCFLFHFRWNRWTSSWKLF